MEEKGKKTEKKAPIQSVERAIRILQCFKGRRDLSLTEISRIVELHKSTVFGLVASLEAFDLLEQDPVTGRYRLGMELFQLGSWVNRDLRRLIAPYMDELVSLSSETVNFMVPCGTDVVYIEKKESPYSMRISTRLGQHQPFYNTAGGKAMLACYGGEQLELILANTVFEKQTDNTAANAEEVHARLAEVRRKGYAVDNEELEYGLICVGKAIVDCDGNPIGAVSISGPSSRMSEEKIKRCADYLNQYCARISAELT